MRRTNSPSYLHRTNMILLTRQSESPVFLEDHNICPRCGATAIRKMPYSDRLKGLSAEAGASELSGKAKADLEPNPQKEEYCLCNGCNFTYVWASVDVKLILEHLRVPHTGIAETKEKNNTNPMPTAKPAVIAPREHTTYLWIRNI